MMDQMVEGKSKILLAAETIFGEVGFESATVRTIAREANVDVALINYHFGSKNGLLEAVLERRADAIHSHRLEALEEARTRLAGTIPPLSEVVGAFILPFKAGSQSDDPGWKGYIGILVQVANDQKWEPTVSRLYNPTARYFVNAIRMAVPELTEEQAFWGYNFMLGLTIQTFSPTKRLDSLSNGLCNQADLEIACAHLVTFVEAGIRAMAQTNLGQAIR